MLISVAITGIVAVACGSVILLAGKTMTLATAGPASQTSTAMDLISVVASDLRLAKTFTERTSTAVTFTVPDRTGDGVDETLRYAWSDAVGATVTSGGTSYSVAPFVLFRQDSGGAPVTVGTNVRSWTFNFLLRTVGQPVQPAPVDSTEQVLCIHDGGTGSNIKSYSLKSTNWIAEYFLPTWPQNTTSWRLTHVQVYMARSTTNATGTVTLEIRAADSAMKPTSTVLGSASVDVTTLTTTKTWVDFTFASPVTGIDPAQGVCVTISTTASSPATIYYDNASADTTMSYTTSNNSGSSWQTPVTGNAMQIYAYGGYTTQAPRPTTPQESAEAFQ